MAPRRTSPERPQVSPGKLVEDSHDFFVAELPKVLVRGSHSNEGLWTGEADDQVRYGSQCLDGLTRPHWHTYHHRGREKATHSRDRSEHGGAGRQAVINQD